MPVEALCEGSCAQEWEVVPSRRAEQHLLGTSLSEATLAAHEDALLERYVDGLRLAGIEYEPAAARSQFAAATTYNLLWPVMACIRYEAVSDRGRETLDSMLSRLGAAIERTSMRGR